MNKHGRPSTKAELIAHYGQEWYDDFLEKNRKRIRDKYWQAPERERKRCRDKHDKNAEYYKMYNSRNREIYRINSRDRNRLMLKGYDLCGMEIHHLVYYRDGNYPNWLDDIMIMTREEHRQWHTDHPEFVAKEHIV